MKSKLMLIPLVTGMLFTVTVSADVSHTVVPGDSMWKIATKYEVGLSEIKNSNLHIKNPDLIYPGDILKIPVTDSKVTAYEKKVIELVNTERAKYNLKPLSYDWQLSRVARIKSQDMKDKGYFSHTSPTYGSPFNMMKSFGITYSYAAENIARGQKTPEAVVKSWMNSSGHRANILSEKYTKIGVGYVENGNYWTQMFIRP
ncbi:MAG: LysM peptidoglycan-binding domain-containing protein [Ruminococcaceae bacterium]|nr:LysM peptidoglycan-binding domain-containing protein [Oscillospiraceae bacterium]